jgi:hypothetical protein
MKFHKFNSLTILILFLFSCNHDKQYKNAYWIVKNKRAYIKIYGTASLMAHDPVSLIIK